MKVAAVYLTLILAATVCSAHFAIGQVPFAAIKGKVTDPSDAVLSDTTLTIRDKQTNVQRESKTARDGSYQFESLDPGEYESYTLALMGEVFNLFNIANLSGYNNMLNQVNYGTPSTRAGQVFGSGGPRAFQFATRLQF